MNRITQTAVRKFKTKEQGFTLVELLVTVTIMLFGFAILISIISIFLPDDDGLQECKNPDAVTNELIKYVEEYNVNNPNNKLGDFEILNSEKYMSETHPQQENDPKFSLIVSKVTCFPYKFDSLNGGHFIIEKGESFTESRRTSDDEWVKIYDSRQP